ncbi:disulfide bond formation protein DsbB [Enterobacteriaceae bacterium LUAb1]
MLQYLNAISRQRTAWLLLALTACLLEAAALWFQHVMLIKPCVMCIYERCALFGVLGAGLVGAVAPGSALRYIAILAWLYSAGKGLSLSWTHTLLQLHPSPFVTCDFAPHFPGGLALDKWLPQVFAASGDCGDIPWRFLTLTMPQWMAGLFAAYLLVGILVFFAQLVKRKKRDLFYKR